MDSFLTFLSNMDGVTMIVFLILLAILIFTGKFQEVVHLVINKKVYNKTEGDKLLVDRVQLCILQSFTYRRFLNDTAYPDLYNRLLNIVSVAFVKYYTEIKNDEGCTVERKYNDELKIIRLIIHNALNTEIKNDFYRILTVNHYPEDLNSEQAKVRAGDDAQLLFASVLATLQDRWINTALGNYYDFKKVLESAYSEDQFVRSLFIDNIGRIREHKFNALRQLYGDKITDKTNFDDFNTLFDYK